MKRLIFFLILLMLSPAIISAQTKSIKSSPPLSEAAAASVGMSQERLNLIDKMCQDAVDKAQVPGVVALVARRGKIVYHKAFGASDASGEALKRDDIFRIASQSKAITATAVMMLWEEGHFGLDEPISNYIPEFKDGQVLDSVLPDGSYKTTPVNKPITIRHLLSHTSGLGYGIIDGDVRFSKMYQDAGVIDLFITKPYREKNAALNDWTLTGLKSAVKVDGTINIPSDKDKGWTLELAIPWKAYKTSYFEKNVPENKHWRVNFSRVNWDFQLEDGKYQRKKDADGKLLHEYNWVWSPQGAIAMHQPETWGLVIFADQKADMTTHIKEAKDL